MNQTNITVCNDSEKPPSLFLPIVQVLGEPFSYIYIALSILVAILLLLNNALPVIALLKNPTLRKKSFLLLGIMAVFDASTSITQILLFTYVRFFNHTLLACRIAAISTIPKWSSVYLQVFIGIDRLCAVFAPRWYWQNMTQKHRITGVSISGILGAFTASLLTAFVDYGWQIPKPCILRNIVPSAVFTFGVRVPIALSGGLILISNVAIIIMSKRMLQRRLALGSLSNMRRKRLVQDHKITGTCVIITMMYLISYFPLFTLSLISEQVGPTSPFYLTVTKVYMMSGVLCQLNNVVNPWVYAIKHVEFRRAYPVICKLPFTEDSSVTPISTQKSSVQ